MLEEPLALPDEKEERLEEEPKLNLRGVAAGEVLK